MHSALLKNLALSIRVRHPSFFGFNFALVIGRSRFAKVAMALSQFFGLFLADEFDTFQFGSGDIDFLLLFVDFLVGFFELLACLLEKGGFFGHFGLKLLKSAKVGGQLAVEEGQEGQGFGGEGGRAEG